MGDGTVQEIYDRLRIVEQETALNGQALKRVEDDLDRLESDKINPMFAQVADLHTTMTRSKGFFGGVFLAAGAMWTVIMGALAAAWKVIGGVS